MQNKFVVLLTIFLLIGQSFGQEMKEKKMLKKARKYLAEANYPQAKDLYGKLIAKDTKNALYHFESGVAYYNSYFERAKALKHFENALEASATDTISEIFYYLGKTHQYIGNYKVANDYYRKFKDYIKENKQGGYVTVQVDRFMQMCNNAITLKNAEDQPTENIIKNLGGGVNSKFAEYGSAVKKDGSFILFTARDRENVGKKYYFDNKKYEDIYVSVAKDTNWLHRTEVDSSKKYFKSSINTKKHDAVIGFSMTEDSLFVYRKNGIWVSELKDGKYRNPTELESINTKGHEPSAILSPDAKTLIFTSNKYDAIGGRDLFTSKRKSDGSWDEPVNMGSVINTKYDEDSPFLTADGKTLFFSSNGHNTIGGYDIFKSEMDESGNWGTPVNMGVGINSAADDIYYSQDSLAEVAYLSSGRAYGYGDMDIYSVSLLCKNIPHTEVRGLIVQGETYKPFGADITAINAETGENVGTFSSDPKTGKYLMILPPDNTYYLTVASQEYEFLGRPFRDTLVLPRQCEYYQMFQYVQVNAVNEENKIAAYEAVFDNATFDVKTQVEENYGVDNINDLLANHTGATLDSAFHLEGEVMHNKTLPVINSRIKLVNSRGEIVRRGITSNAGKFEFRNVDPNESYTLLVDEEDVKKSYYGNSPANNENSIIAKGNIKMINTRLDNSIISTNPLDSVEILLTGANNKIVNITASDTLGDWVVDNLPANPVNDPRAFPYNLQMQDEDILYRNLMKESDTTDNELYSIIRDLIPLPEDVEPPVAAISFEPIYFDFDKFFLRLKSKEVLEKIYNYMAENDDVKIEIMGHTDWFGTDKYNVKLSKRRSQSAFDYLASKGIDKSRLTMKWFGEAEPAVPNANPDGSDNPESRQLNRRCEFMIGDQLTAFTIVLN